MVVPSFRENGTWEYMGLLKNATEPQGLSEWQWNNMWGASWLECCKNIVAEWQMSVKYFMVTCTPVSLMTNWKYKSIHIYWNRKRFHNHVVLWVLQISDAESSCSALLRSVLCDEKCSKLRLYHDMWTFWPQPAKSTLTIIKGRFHEIVQFGEKEAFWPHTDQPASPMMINNVNFLGWLVGSSTNATSRKGCQGKIENFQFKVFWPNWPAQCNDD